MDSFYTIVLSIAVICLILVLIVFALILRKANKNKTFPPTQSRCPDYWETDASGNCVVTGTTNIGPFTSSSGLTSSSGPDRAIVSGKLNPDAPSWATYMGASTSICGKKAWANKYQISWDGVANYNGC